MPQHNQQRNVSAFHFTLHERVIERLHQLSRAAAARRERSHAAIDHRAIERGSSAFAAGIAECDHEVRVRMLEKIVKVARDFTRGP